MKRTRMIAPALCLIMALSCLFTACGGDSKPETASSLAVSQESSSAQKNDISDYVAMPEFRWTGQEGFGEFHLCIYSNEEATTYFCEDIVPGLYSTTEVQLDDAVARRNDEIESKYGVRITADAVANVVETFKNDVGSSLNTYNAAIPYMHAATSLAADGYLYDLYQLSDYIHLDQPWWDKNAADSASIGNRLYMITGDISIMPKIVSFAITFNKEMLAKNFPGTDLYQTVRDGEWTFDRMVEMSKTVTSDSDGEAGMTYKDTWGLSSSYSDATAYYLASGKSLIKKDANDMPELAIGDEASVSAAIKVLQNLELEDVWVFHCNTAQGQVPNIWQTSLDVFGENRCLFRTSAFSAIKKLRAYDDADEFGLIPMPKLDAEQENYYTYCNTVYAFCAVIPSSVSTDEAEFSAYMLELMAYGGMKYITPAYYETILKSRDLRDSESEEMLDNYIFKNVVYDTGNIYNFGNIQGAINSLCEKKSTDVASTLESIKSSIETAIEETVEQYAHNG